MRILFVSTRPPWLCRRGDQARLAGWLDALSQKHEVAVVCQRPPGFPLGDFPSSVVGRQVGLSPWRMGRSLIHGFAWPLQVALHYQPALERQVADSIAKFRPDVAVVILSRLGWLLPVLRDVPVVLDLVDSLALNMRRRAARQPILKPFWSLEASRIEAWDRHWIGRVARALVVSAKDRTDLIAGAPHLSDRIEVVPFGMSLPVSLERTERKESVVLLSGNLGYFPTCDGALWLAREVWPRVRRFCPDAQWWLAGSRPTRALRRLGRLPGVRLIVDPEDLSALRRQAAVAVAPMRSGSGTPIKVLEAMADGLPVVATPESASGLDGIDSRELQVAASPNDFAEAIVRLLENPQAAKAQAEAGWAWLSARHDLGRSAARFEAVLEAVVAGR